MKRLIVALLVAAVLSGTAWGLTAALSLNDGTSSGSSPTTLSNTWDLTNSASFTPAGPGTPP